MKHLYICLMTLCFCGASAQVINFPDPAFKAACVIWADYDFDNEVTQAEAAMCNFLQLNDGNIVSLSGLEYFTALETLWIYNTSICEFN